MYVNPKDKVFIIITIITMIIIIILTYAYTRALEFNTYIILFTSHIMVYIIYFEVFNLN